MHSILEKLDIKKKTFVTIFICFAIMCYFLFYTIFGNRGIIDYFHLKQELKAKNLEKTRLLIKIKDKKQLVDAMQNESLDLDLLDEEVRKNLGQAKKNEIIVKQQDIK